MADETPGETRKGGGCDGRGEARSEVRPRDVRVPGGAGQQVVGWIYGSLVKQENNVDESAQMGGTTSAGVNREPPQQPSEGVVTRIWRAIRSWFGN